ncbi:hypothetical protein [Microvirga subterranea]|uniref:Uncharacterized protein n=1 Tax=Microvirga subterranea TaxID=186651 RepID=A0A370HHN5_9HYPH|nr:hypothetical protein [Microvirga subterranea]RDI57249.1 hypothetical protein DES45_107166 [Microvirga subterranea]
MTSTCKVWMAAGSLIVATLSPSGASAQEGSFLDRFKGVWIGSGHIQRNAETSPWNVNCTVNGDRAPDRISIQGNCRAALVLQRRIAADIAYDVRTGLYRGVYTGARVGPARLSGTRRGDAVRLTIDWPKPVNGDMQAEMIIVNEGSGMLRIVVRDNLVPGGPVQQTSELILRQR